MTLKELYEIIDGNFDQVLNQIRSEAIIDKFIGKFLNDKTFEMLTEAINAKNWDAAFLHSHTLKGVTSNFAFTPLVNATVLLTDELREKNRPTMNKENVENYYKLVAEQYKIVTENIKKYIESK